MKKKESNKKFIIIITIFCLVIILLSILFYINLKNKFSKTTIDATVLYIGDDYMVISDDKEQEYTIPLQEDYNIGDRLTATFKNLNYDKNPIEGDVIELKTISKTVSFAIQDSIVQNTEIPAEEANILKENTITSQSTSEISTTENDIVNYLEQLNYQLDTSSSNASITDNLKNGFITVVDFLFYNGTIKGKTFSELSDITKLKILKLTLSIDQKIETKFPNYKEEVSQQGTRVYTNIKSKVVETYLNITTSACENNQDICQSAKEGLKDLKESFSLTWNFIKEISGVGVSKLKSWYEVWKSCQ